MNTVSNKFTKIWQRFFLIAGNIVFFLIFLLLLTTDEQHFRETTNLKLFAINIPVILILCAAYFLLPQKQTRFQKHPLMPIITGYLFLFVLQCTFVHFTYFYTGWDVSLMRFRVTDVLAGLTMQEAGADVTYSVNPNNLFLFYMQYLISKVGELFSMKYPYNLCIYFSCFCVSTSCFLGNLMIRKITQSSLIRFLYTLISTVYLLFSPWIVVPYSDTYGMLFVSLGSWAIICLEKPAFKWPVLAFAAMIGYQIKPTCIFLLFATVILYLPEFVAGFRQKWKEVCILLFSSLIFFGIGQGASPWIQHSLSFQLNPELKFPPTHFMMMGLNIDSRGGFDASDYLSTTDISTYAEKQRFIKEEIEYRWNTMDLTQKKEHFISKLLYNYNDGTFSWTGEGAFFETPVEHDNPLNDLYLEIFHPDGTYFTAYFGFAQIIWLLLLFGILFTFLNLKEQASNKAFLMIVLCGLTVFVMLFEARARYLLLYAPAFLILSLYGYESLFSLISTMIRKKGRTS